MKLSEVRGERVFVVIADIIEPIATIAQDEDAVKLFDAKDRPEDVTPWEFFVERAKTSIPVLMKRYKDEICEIMAAINGVSARDYIDGVMNPDYDESKAGEEGYAEPMYTIPPLTIPKLFADVLDLVTDGEFVSFFS